MNDHFIRRISGILGDAYVVERELAAGMSRVVVARDVALGRRVVIKVLPVDLAAGLSVDRFRREVVLAAGLQHPHIVPLLTAAEAPDGTLYYTMPYVDGQSLRDRVRNGIPTLSESVRWLRDVASALSYAHARGVVHRDMKPDNILLSGEYALVADFGIAKALSNAGATLSGMSVAVDPITTLGMALGTPAYMAPEQVAADTDADYRADIYALGIIAYELLTGETPFKGSAQAILIAHLTVKPKAIGELRGDIPLALSALIMQCLEKNALDRPQSADQIVLLLENTLRGISADSRAAAESSVNSDRGSARGVNANAERLNSNRLVEENAAAVQASSVTNGALQQTSAAHQQKRKVQLITAAVVGAMVLAGVLVRPLVSTSASIEHRVAVATFRYIAADSSLREIARALSSDISNELSALDGSDIATRDDVEQAEASLSRESTSPQKIAKAVRASTVVTGIVSVRGADSVGVQVTLTSGSDGKTIRTLNEVVAARNDIHGSTTTLRQRVAGAIAVLNSTDFTAAMLPEGDPPVLSALLAVREGLQLETSLRLPDPNEDEALAELERFYRAVNADPEYSQARLWFASAALRRTGGEALADSALNVVHSQSGKLTEYERALSDALTADASGNHELSVRSWRRAQQLAPTWPNVWWLAIKLRDANRPREALKILDSLGQHDARFRRGLPSLRHYLGDFVGEYRALEDERRRAPSTAQSLGYQQALLQALSAMDSVSAAMKLLVDASQLPAEPGSSQAFLLTRTSWELAAHKHAKESMQTLQRAVTWCRRRTSADFAKNGAVAFDCMEAYAYAGEVKALSALASPLLRARADDLDISMLGVLGIAASLRGEKALAEKFANRIETATRVDGSRGVGSWCRARIAAASGDTTRAVELLEDAFARGAGWLQRLDLHRDPAFATLRGIAAFERLRQPQG